MTQHTTFEKDRLDQEVDNFLFEIEEEKKRKEEETSQAETKAKELSEFKKQAVIEYYLQIEHNIYAKNSISCENGVLYYEIKEDCVRLYFVEKYLAFKLHEALEGGFFLDFTFKNKTYLRAFENLLTNEIFVNEILVVIKYINIEKDKTLHRLIYFISRKDDCVDKYPYLNYGNSDNFTTNLLEQFKKSSLESFVKLFANCPEIKCERAKDICLIRDFSCLGDRRTSSYSHTSIRDVHYEPIKCIVNEYVFETRSCHEETYDKIFGKSKDGKVTKKEEDIIEELGSFRKDVMIMFPVGIFAFLSLVTLYHRQDVYPNIVLISINVFIILCLAKRIIDKFKKPKTSTTEASNRSPSHCQEFPPF